MGTIFPELFNHLRLLSFTNCLQNTKAVILCNKGSVTLLMAQESKETGTMLSLFALRIFPAPSPLCRHL